MLRFGNYPWAWKMSAHDVDEHYAEYALRAEEAPKPHGSAATLGLTEDEIEALRRRQNGETDESEATDVPIAMQETPDMRA